jgi:uncharacterized protein
MDVFRATDAASKAAVRAMAKDGYDNFLNRVGLNTPNLLSGGTYEFNLVTRNRTLLEAAYRGSWITGRVVDSVADDMTRAGVSFTTKDDEDVEVFQKKLTRLAIWWSLNLLIKWGRLYGGAIGVLQILGQDLSSPLNLDSIGKGQFKGIAVYDRWMVNPVMSPVISTGPNIGLPVYYQLIATPQSYDPSAQPATGLLNVHHSRCIRYTGIDLPFFQAITEMMWGESVLERLWDRLISFDNASLSAAQLVDRANLRTVGIENLREVIAAGGDAYEGMLKFFEAMRQFQDNEGLTLLDKNDVFASTAYSFAGLSDMMLQQAQQVSGACEIPLIVLMSQSPAGLGDSGDTDLRIYYDNVKKQQEAKLRNPLSSLFEVMWRSTFGKPTPDDFDFDFVSLWQETKAEKANTAKTNTETIIGAFQSDLVTKPAAMRELRDSSGETGLFSNISDEDIAEAEAEPEEPPIPDASVIPGKPGEPVEPEKPATSGKTGDSPDVKAWKRLYGWLFRG